jgi:hypothetical protein
LYESGVRQSNVGSKGLARAGISYDLERLQDDYQNRFCALVLAYVLGRRRAERSAPLSAAEKQRSTSSSIFVSERSSGRARELKKPGQRHTQGDTWCAHAPARNSDTRNMLGDRKTNMTHKSRFLRAGAQNGAKAASRKPAMHSPTVHALPLSCGKRDAQPHGARAAAELRKGQL